MTDATQERKTGAEDVLWDLSVYYDSMDDPKVDEDIDALNTNVDKFVADYRGKVATLDPESMVVALQELETIYDKAGEIGTYASLNFTTMSNDPQWGAFIQRVTELGSQMQQKLVFFMLEWNSIDDADANKILAHPTTGSYAYHLEAERRNRPYQLSEAEEKILLEKGVTGRNAWTRLFSQIQSGITYDWDGETINQAQLLSKITNSDRDVRKRAADMLTETLNSKAMELTYIYNTIAADKASDDRLRGYDSWISARNISNKAPDAVVDALIETVTGNYALVARHYEIKRRLLGFDELFDYDRYAPLNLKESETFYTWDEAKQIVLDAFRKFSPSLANAAQKFFDENWIHAPVMQGKRGGAYASYGTKSTHPFVFVNFTGTASDVMTLAHELGHGVHMYFSSQAQSYFGMATPLTTAEMASTFAEMLVFSDLMEKETDDEVKLAMLSEKIDSAFATIFRQVSMNRFEHGLHTGRREKGELSTEALNEIWMETQRDMFQGSVTMRDEYAQWWSYIPHFLHTPGYVYAYAFGELLVLALYNLYQEEGTPFIPKYETLLADGDSDYPDKLLAKVGVDLNDAGFWQQGVDALAELIDQEEALAKSLFPARFV
ncbi:MAG: M3 family oligoendopeptidase [Aggregatilineales bacterium]